MIKKNSLQNIFSTLTNQIPQSDLAAVSALANASVLISRARISLGYTQRQFAEYMGVSQGMVSKWENGDYNFSLETLAKIFYKLDIKMQFCPQVVNPTSVEYRKFTKSSCSNTDPNILVEAS